MNLIEYVIVSMILMTLLVVLLLLVNTTILVNPADQLSSVAFTDIGNGVSTRIVGVYAIAPRDGRITTLFDIPDDVAGKEYRVFVGPGSDPSDQDITVSAGGYAASISLAGIGASRGVTGNTTGRGLNLITYDSGGV